MFSDQRGHHGVDVVIACTAARCAGCAGPAALMVGKADPGRVMLMCSQGSGAQVESVFLHGVPLSTPALFDVGAEVLQGYDEDWFELRHAARPISPAE